MLVCSDCIVICMKQTTHAKTVYTKYSLPNYVSTSEKLTLRALYVNWSVVKIYVGIAGKMVICTYSFHNWFCDMQIFIWMEKMQQVKKGKDDRKKIKRIEQKIGKEI